MSSERPRWTYLSNHGHVLISLATDPTKRLRDVAVEIGLTERAVQLIVKDLVEEGVLLAHRVGRRNRYDLLPDRPLRHSVESHRTVRDLLDLVVGEGLPARSG